MSNSHEDDVDAELFASLAGALATAVPDAALKARLMRSVDDLTPAVLPSVGRPNDFARFVDRIAALTDLARDQAQELVDALDDVTRWVGAGTAMAIFHVGGGPRVHGAIVGFVRMPAGAAFPQHEHVGDEVMLVMQGALVMNGSTHGAGAEVTSSAGSSHCFVAAPGSDLMYLGVIQGGMKIDGHIVTPSDPSF